MGRGGKRWEEVGRGGKMEELFEKADWLCYTCFYQEIADGRARRGGGPMRDFALALLHMFSSRNCRWTSSPRRPTAEGQSEGQ